MSTTNAAHTTAPGTATVWDLGDYDRVARDVIPAFGPELVTACGIGPGTRVLDVGAGSGNVAIVAAAAGAQVVASDPAATLLDVGRERAQALGLTLEWVQAHAEALPFADGTFDVVTSAVGVMFAADHRAAGRELTRVCARGGRIGMINWTPDGWAAELFELLERHAPRPAVAAPPPSWWGDGSYVSDLLGDAVTGLAVTHGSVVKGFRDPGALCDYYRRYFGPVIAAYRALADDPDRRAALDRDFAAFARRTNTARPGAPAAYRLDYVRITAERR